MSDLVGDRAMVVRALYQSGSGLRFISALVLDRAMIIKSQGCSKGEVQPVPAEGCVTRLRVGVVYEQI